MAECSFAPKVNSKTSVNAHEASSNPGARKMGGKRFEHLHEQAVKQQTKAAPPTTDEKELAECTFKPVLNDYRKSNAAMPPGYEHVVQRMRRAQNERVQAEADALAEARRRAALAGKPAQPFTFQTDKRSERRHPLLYMDINLGPGKTGRIGLHGDDDPDALAANFARAYGLDGAMQNKLAGLIERYLVEVVPDIINEQGAAGAEGGAPPPTTPAPGPATARSPASAGSAGTRSVTLK